MKPFYLLFLFFLSPLQASHLLIFEESSCTLNQKIELFNLILKEDAPRGFYNLQPIDLEAASHQILPSIHLKWIPPSLFQLGILHAFFHDPVIRNSILACSLTGWEPLQYEEALESASCLEEIVDAFDRQTLCLPNLCHLFFQVNKAVISLQSRAAESDLEMLHLLLSEIPPLSEWNERGFPFWKSAWIYNEASIENFYHALKNVDLLTELLKIETLAHENREWVLYRGYSGLDYPSTIQFNRQQSHALSFGSTLLGGAFFSLEASALTYATADTREIHNFLALRVSPQELKKLFRIGPLHPLIQMLVDGEMFHAHTKISIKNVEEEQILPLEGYFMKCNKKAFGPIGYKTCSELTKEELEEEFHRLCRTSGHIFLSESY